MQLCLCVRDFNCLREDVGQRDVPVQTVDVSVAGETIQLKSGKREWSELARMDAVRSTMLLLSSRSGGGRRGGDSGM